MLPALPPELIFHETVKFVSCCHKHQLTKQRLLFNSIWYAPLSSPLSIGPSLQYCVSKVWELKILGNKMPSLFCKPLHCILFHCVMLFHIAQSLPQNWINLKYMIMTECSYCISISYVFCTPSQANPLSPSTGGSSFPSSPKWGELGMRVVTVNTEGGH